MDKTNRSNGYTVLSRSKTLRQCSVSVPSKAETSYTVTQLPQERSRLGNANRLTLSNMADDPRITDANAASSYLYLCSEPLYLSKFGVFNKLELNLRGFIVSLVMSLSFRKSSVEDSKYKDA